MEDLDHLTASRSDLLSWCCRWKNELLTHGVGRDRLLYSTSNIIVKINDAAVVKFGPSVTASEAANQSYAYDILALARSQVSVPRVHQYFEHGAADSRIGYLVMEYIHGKLVADLFPGDVQNCIRKLSMAIQTMWQSVSDRPGPIDGGEPRGTIWAPDQRAYNRFNNKRDLERWFDRALQAESMRMNLNATPLVFCHLDLAGRNLIRGENSVVYLLDWACAGFYPWILEIWVLRSFRNNELEFAKALLSTLPELNGDEEQLCDTLWQAYRLNMLHNWSKKLSNIPTEAQMY